MKYIRGQDGGIYSVSRLKPPCRVTSEGEAIWRMTVVTADGEHCTYATYSTEALAIKAFKAVTEFIGIVMNVLVFELGVDGKPDWQTAEEYMADPDVVAAGKALEKRAEEIGGATSAPPEVRPWISMPRSPSFLRWRHWWPWNRKGGSR